MDMSMMVEQQGYQLEKVESYSSVAKVHLEQGRTFLTKAIRSAKATRAVKYFKRVLQREMLIHVCIRKNGAVFLFVLLFVS
jgi:t-SNARE complex subunit (syntaxin)